MFRQFARDLKEQFQTRPPSGLLPLGVRELPAGVSAEELVFLFHPIQLAGLLEAAWAERFQTEVRQSPIPALPGGQGGQFPPGGFLDKLLELLCIQMPNRDGQVGCINAVVFDHLIYAYMIENTRIYEIFRRVLYEYLHGERLETPSEQSQRWLRATEELFYSDTPPFFAFQLISHIRPDIRASRRNAYYRMFGMDLNYGTDDGRPHPYERAAAANRDFVSTFEAFLQEVWRGILNRQNSSGPNYSDDSAIADLAARLFHMMKDRRENGNLSREEFFFVSTMSWFHLTVEFNSSIVRDLKADGSNPAERLRAIGERVGLPMHGKAYDLFNLADPMSRVLIAVESGSFNNIGNAPILYSDPPTQIRRDIETIITNWSSATGRSMKAVPVTASPNGAISRAPAPSGAMAPATVSPGAISPDGGSRVLAPRT